MDEAEVGHLDPIIPVETLSMQEFLGCVRGTSLELRFGDLAYWSGIHLVKAALHESSW